MDKIEVTRSKVVYAVVTTIDIGFKQAVFIKGVYDLKDKADEVARDFNTNPQCDLQYFVLETQYYLE